MLALMLALMLAAPGSKIAMGLAREFTAPCPALRDAVSSEDGVRL
jgi:hypothetical protein